MDKGQSSLKRHGVKIVTGVMLCILIFLAGMTFSLNSKLTHFQASMEKRVSELEKRQNSIEQSLGILKKIQPEIEGIHQHWEVLKRKMTVLQGALERFVDELSEPFSKEQKEKMKKAISKLSPLWEAFGEFMEDLEAENREMKERRQGEGGEY
jgi:chromosome segregation ATPase